MGHIKLMKKKQFKKVWKFCGNGYFEPFLLFFWSLKLCLHSMYKAKSTLLFHVLSKVQMLCSMLAAKPNHSRPYILVFNKVSYFSKCPFITYVPSKKIISIFPYSVRYKDCIKSDKDSWQCISIFYLFPLFSIFLVC